MTRPRTSGLLVTVTYTLASVVFGLWQRNVFAGLFLWLLLVAGLCLLALMLEDPPREPPV